MTLTTDELIIIAVVLVVFVVVTLTTGIFIRLTRRD